MYRTRSVSHLKSQIKQKTEQLNDPLKSNKISLFHEIETMNQRLLAETDQPYFCDACGYMHRKGQIYADHKSHGRIKVKWPPISPTKFLTIFKVPMKDLSILQSVQICQNIPPYTAVSLYLENLRGDKKIGVVYNRQKIGVLKGVMGELPSFFTDANNDTEIEAFFSKYQQAGTYYQSSSAMIHVSVFQKTQIKQYVHGLLELASMGHPELSNAFLMWTPKARDYAIAHLNTVEDPHKAKLVEYLNKVEKFHYKKDSDFPIML